MKIYFDDVLIDENNYLALSKTGTLFEDSFILGKTVCENYKLTLNKEAKASLNPEVVKIYEGEILKKVLYVDSYTEEDLSITYELTDGMVKFNFAYDASSLIGDSSATLLQIFNDICSKAGVETDIKTFLSANLQVTWIDNTITAREYLGFIGELNSGIFLMSNDGKLIFKSIVQTPSVSISFDDISNYKIGTKHVITRVVFDNGSDKWEYGDETGETYYINTSNVYLVNQGQVEAIYNSIKNLTYYNFESDNIPFDNISEVGDVITFTNEGIEYNVYVQYADVSYSGNNWFGGISLQVKNNMQEETEIINSDQKIRGLKILVDRENNLIRQTIKETNTRIDNSNTTINNNYQEILSKFNGTATTDELEAYQKAMQTQLDANQLEISNIQTAIINGVEKVVTTSGTFDENGLTMRKTGAKTETTLNEIGMDIKDTQGSGEDLLFTGYVDEKKAKDNRKLSAYEGQTVTYTKNLIVDNYVSIGTHSRIEDYEDGTGIFYIGG